jgi:hypothetical protein
LLRIDLASDTVFDKRLGGAAEGHADVHGGGASLAQMLHLVTAVAGAHSHVLGGVDHLAGPFVVHHRERVIPGNGPLVHKRAANPGLAPGEEVLHEILFHVQVLEVEFGQQLLVVSVAHAHHRELEKTGHGRRQYKDLFPPHFHVEQHSFGGKSLKDVSGFGGGFVPYPCRRGHVEGFDGKQRHQRRFIPGEQNLQYPEEEFGRRSALRKEVQPVRQCLVAVLERHMGHRGPLVFQDDDGLIHYMRANVACSAAANPMRRFSSAKRPSRS